MRKEQKEQKIIQNKKLSKSKMDTKSLMKKLNE